MIMIGWVDKQIIKDENEGHLLLSSVFLAVFVWKIDHI